MAFGVEAEQEAAFGLWIADSPNLQPLEGQETSREELFRAKRGSLLQLGARRAASKGV